MKRGLKSSRGVTLMSLAVYIASLLITLTFLTMATAHFRGNLNKMSNDVIDVVELDKFNLYLLEETKRTNNEVTKISEDKKTIEFITGNQYQFVQGEESIYLINENENRKVVLRVNSCEFSMYNEFEKTIILANITVGREKRELRYVMNHKIKVE